MVKEEKTFEEEFTLSVQKKFLGLLMYDKSWAAINGLEIILPEYFENDKLKRICKWIHEYYNKYKCLPTKPVLKELATDFVNSTSHSDNDYYAYDKVIEDICSLEDIAEADYFKNKAIDFVKQVSWRQALAKGGDVLKVGNYEEAINAFRKVLLISAENDIGLDFSETSTDTFIEKLTESYDTSNMLKTGIPDWDKALGGGFVRKNVHIIAAPPGHGKSRIMAYLTRQAMATNKRVIFITLELDQIETMANINTSITGFGINDMLTLAKREEFSSKINVFKNTYNPDLIIKFFKPSTINADTIYNFIQKVIQKKEEKTGIPWKPDVIFIDYMDKMLPIQKVKGNSYEDMGGVANDCKNLGISFDCPVITASQLGKYSWNLTGSQVVSMDSIAESAQKVHIAHSMTTVNANPDEKAAGKARLFMAKSRSGSPGTTIYCMNNLGRCLLEQIEPWDPSNPGIKASYEVKSSSK